jgi:hypothetical protein
MAMSTFRRNTKAEQGKKGGGKGLRGNWREQMRLPKAAPTPFVLIKGEYNDPNPDPEMVEIDMQTGQQLPSIVAYWKWLKHRKKTMGFNGKERFIDEPCSKGYEKHAPKPCAGCQAQDLGDKSVTLSETFSMGFVHLKLYHRHPLFDMKQKQWVVKKDKPGEPVMVESECLEKQCNFCRVQAGQQPVLQPNEFWPGYQPQHIQNVFGSRRYLELGSGHLGDIGEWDKQIGARCGGLVYVKDAAGNYVVDPSTGQAIPKGRCNNFLSVDGYACSVCGNTLIDAEQDPRPLDQLEALALKKYPCHVCNRPVFMKEMNSCDTCGSPVVNGIFEGVLWGQRQGEGTNSHLVLVQYDTVEDFEANLHPSVRALFQGKNLRQRIEELAKPYNFEELYKPKSLEDQAKRLELNIQTQGGMMPPPGYGAQPQQFFGQNGPPAPQGYPQQTQQYGAQPQYPQGYPQQQGQPPAQQPQYTQYTTPTSPGPAPFVPPAQPNFSK